MLGDERRNLAAFVVGLCGRLARLRQARGHGEATHGDRMARRQLGHDCDRRIGGRAAGRAAARCRVRRGVRGEGRCAGGAARQLGPRRRGEQLSTLRHDAAQRDGSEGAVSAPHPQELARRGDRADGGRHWRGQHGERLVRRERPAEDGTAAPAARAPGEEEAGVEGDAVDFVGEALDGQAEDGLERAAVPQAHLCLLYTSDAADDM
eukprot:2993155-Prymnesium_polylepis.2